MNNENLINIPNNLKSYTYNYSAAPYNNLGMSINLFCSENNPLKGEAWDSFKKKLSLLNDEIGTLKKYSGYLNELINEASIDINRVLGTYNGNIKMPDQIEYGKEFEKIDSMIQSLTAEIRSLENSLYKTKFAGYYDEEQTKPKYELVIDTDVEGELIIKREEKIDWENYQAFINELYKLYKKYSIECDNLGQKFSELNENLYDFVK